MKSPREIRIKEGATPPGKVPPCKPTCHITCLSASSALLTRTALGCINAALLFIGTKEGRSHSFTAWEQPQLHERRSGNRAKINIWPQQHPAAAPFSCHRGVTGPQVRCGYRGDTSSSWTRALGPPALKGQEMVPPTPLLQKLPHFYGQHKGNSSDRRGPCSCM